MVPVIYNQSSIPNESRERFFDSLMEYELRSLASELKEYGFGDMDEIHQAIERAIRVCQAVNIPVKSNFKRFYAESDGQIEANWRISDLGKRLILINASPSNPYVAKIQMTLINASIK